MRRAGPGAKGAAQTARLGREASGRNQYSLCVPLPGPRDFRWVFTRFAFLAGLSPRGFCLEPQPAESTGRGGPGTRRTPLPALLPPRRRPGAPRGSAEGGVRSAHSSRAGLPEAGSLINKAAWDAGRAQGAQRPLMAEVSGARAVTR